jgi:hypothetical protein
MIQTTIIHNCIIILFDYDENIIKTNVFNVFEEGKMIIANMKVEDIGDYSIGDSINIMNKYNVVTKESKWSIIK